MGNRDPGIAIDSPLGRYRVEAMVPSTGVHSALRAISPEGQVCFLKYFDRPGEIPSPPPQLLPPKSRSLRYDRLSQDSPLMQLIEHFCDDSKSCLVSEFLPGIDLHQFIIHHRPVAQEALHILRQLARGLDELHVKGFLHRDIKPQNIRLSSTLKATWVDFDLLTPIDQQDSGIKPFSTPLQGTLIYMSPEQQQGGAATIASDLYAFAIVAYELSIGQLSRGRIDLQLLPPSLRSIFAQALDYDPRKRFLSAISLVEALGEGWKELPTYHLSMRSYPWPELSYKSPSLRFQGNVVGTSSFISESSKLLRTRMPSGRQLLSPHADLLLWIEVPPSLREQLLDLQGRVETRASWSLNQLRRLWQEFCHLAPSTSPAAGHELGSPSAALLPLSPQGYPSGECYLWGEMAMMHPQLGLVRTLKQAWSRHSLPAKGRLYLFACPQQRSVAIHECSTITQLARRFPQQSDAIISRCLGDQLAQGKPIGRGTQGGGIPLLSCRLQEGGQPLQKVFSWDSLTDFYQYIKKTVAGERQTRYKGCHFSMNSRWTGV